MNSHDFAFELFTKRKRKIASSHKIACQNTLYLTLITEYLLTEINPDIVLFPYEQAINENRYYLAETQVSDSDHFWLIGCSGQGDLWLLDQNDTVYWFDHDQGEFALSLCQNMAISFLELLKLAVLLVDIEQKEQQDPAYFESATHQAALINGMNELKSGLYERYPYRYF